MSETYTPACSGTSPGSSQKRTRWYVEGPSYYLPLRVFAILSLLITSCAPGRNGCGEGLPSDLVRM